MKYSTHLRKEHELIGLAHTLLDLVVKNEDSRPAREIEGSLQLLLSFFEEFVLDLHFRKEEEVLFPVVRQKELDQKGGPKCGDFMGRTQMWHYAADLTEWGRDEISGEYKVADKLAEVLGGKSSGLSLPLEEHEAAFYAVELFKVYLGRSDEEGKRKARKLLRLFLNMLEEHRLKEDDCLLVLFEKNASDELQESMYKEVELIEKEFGTDRISAFYLGLSGMAKTYGISFQFG